MKGFGRREASEFQLTLELRRSLPSKQVLRDEGCGGLRLEICSRRGSCCYSKLRSWRSKFYRCWAFVIQVFSKAANFLGSKERSNQNPKP